MLEGTNTTLLCAYPNKVDLAALRKGCRTRAGCLQASLETAQAASLKLLMI